MSGWLVDFFGHVIFWVGIPALLVLSVLAPFLFIKKVLKRRFNVWNLLLASLVAGGLLIVDFYILYQGFAILQGIAFCQLQGQCQDLSIF